MKCVAFIEAYGKDQQEVGRVMQKEHERILRDSGEVKERALKQIYENMQKVREGLEEDRSQNEDLARQNEEMR